MANQNAVVNAILAATQNPQIQAAMLLGSRMESSWSTTAVGDNGTSFGPFQIHLPAHPGVSQAEAEDPTWAVNYMLPVYTAGVAAVPASLWGTNPSLAAATAAYHAERPKNMYASSVISADWPYVTQALGGNSAAVGSGSASPGTTGNVSTASSVFGDLGTQINVALNDIYVGLLVFVGIVLMGVGLVLIFRDALNFNIKIPKLGGSSNGGTTQQSAPQSRPAQSNASPAKASGRKPSVRTGGLSPQPARTTSARVKPAATPGGAPTVRGVRTTP